MKQVLQNLKSGETEVIEVPTPPVKAGHLRIKSRVSLISTGTERMLVEFGRAGYLAKARNQPEKVKQVLQKARTDGVIATANTVRSRLEEPQPLGYSNVGVVLEVGEGVEGWQAGDRVVSNGRHAEQVVVPKHLCARIPDEVPDDDASFAVVASIGLQGVRLLKPTLGESFVVYGLGLIGLLSVQILRANGCRVIGIDLDPERTELARQSGAEAVTLTEGTDPVQAARAFAGATGGVDGVLITVSTESDEPIRNAAHMCRKRGRIVLVGVTGLKLNRADFYEKELSFQVSCSYGPGRYDSEYEQKGNDYPVGFVRWTEKRNFDAVLELLRAGHLQVQPFMTRSAPIQDAAEVYSEIVNSKLITALLRYPSEAPANQRTVRNPDAPQPRREADAVVAGVIGAGNFAKAVLLPALQNHGVELRTIASFGGLSSASAARKFGFQFNTNDLIQVFSDAEINTLFIATRHDSHAELVVRALEAGRNVFVEKPLAMDAAELEAVLEAARRCGAGVGGPRLFVGFNRRFAPLIERTKGVLNDRSYPISMIITVNAGSIPPDHWTRDDDIGGGRIIGEACHFIDLLIHLADSPIKRISAVQMGAQIGRASPDANMTITAELQDGSHGTVHYFANGHKSFPKERIEVFSEGRILQVDNFRRFKAWGAPSMRFQNPLARQDKGHDSGVSAFVNAIRTGSPSPIPLNELANGARATFAAVSSARQRRPIEIDL